MRGVIEQILRIAEIDGRLRPERMGALDKGHAAIVGGGILERDPDGGLVPAVDMRPVHRILMPGRTVVALHRLLEQGLVVPDAHGASLKAHRDTTEGGGQRVAGNVGMALPKIHLLIEDLLVSRLCSSLWPIGRLVGLYRHRVDHGAAHGIEHRSGDHLIQLDEPIPTILVDLLLGERIVRDGESVVHGILPHCTV